MKADEKFYYIGEVSKMVDVPQHIIRFWEKQFSVIHPLRDQRGNRIYTKKDIETINKIRVLIYNKGYRIKGVKKILRGNVTKNPGRMDKKILLKILKELKEIEKCLQ